MGIPPEITAPGTYMAMHGYFASWIVQQASFEHDGTYSIAQGTMSTLEIFQLQRTPGARLAGRLTSSLVHSGTQAPASGTFEFDVILQ